MEFSLSEEQVLIRDMARDFAKNELGPNAGEWDQTAEFPVDAIKQMAELGLMGVNIPEDLGGAQCGPVALSLAIRLYHHYGTLNLRKIREQRW